MNKNIDKETINQKTNLEEGIEKARAMADEYMKKEFAFSFTELEAKKDKEFMEKLGENKKYIKQLEGTPYNFGSKGFIYTNQKEDVNEIISNVLVIPSKKYNYKTENETKSNIEIKGILAPTGEELPTISIPIQQIDNGNWFVNSSWGLKVKFELPVRKSIQINCLKELSKYMEEETIYEYTGFTEINGKKAFLHTGGAIGIDNDIRVELEDENLNRYAFTNKEFKIEDSLKTTLQCLDVAPKNITLPILALVFMSPLTSMFDDLGIPIGFLTWLQGPQQCKKTSMVSAFCSHFGNFNKNSAPMNFTDSIASVKEKSAKLKDVLVLVDDYFPTSNKQEASEMKKFAEKLIQLTADKMAGSRSKANGKTRKTYRCKGQLIATAEIFPDLSQSRISRVLFINVKKDDIKPKELKIIQDHQEELQYSMKKYIEYIIENYETIVSRIKEIFETKREEASEKVTFRTGEMLVGLYIGYSTLIDFACLNGIVTEEEKNTMLQEGWNILLELGKEQNTMMENVSPINMLLSAIEVLTNTGKLTIVDYESAKFMKHEDIMKDGFIGFYDESNKINLIYPDLLYKAVKNFYNQQQIEFPWNKATMCKELLNQKYLYKTDKQERPQIRRENPRNKKEETFIGLLQDKIYIACRYNENGIILTK